MSGKSLLALGCLKAWLDPIEANMARRLGANIDEPTAREFVRNATIRERMHVRMKMHYRRPIWKRVRREVMTLEWLARRFGVRSAA